MNRTIVREYLKRHVLGLLAIFIALSGTAIAAGDGPTASSSVVTTAKFKKLKQRVGALESKLDSPASGDLTGKFPNLQIAANAVGSNEIANNAVGTGEIADSAVNAAKIATDAVGSDEIATDAVGSGEIATDAVGSGEIATGAVGPGDEIANSTVGADELKTPVVRQGAGSQVIANGGTNTSVTGGCFVTEDLLGGAYEWSPTSAVTGSISMLFFGPSFTTPRGVEAGATNNSGISRTLFADANCLPE